MTTWKSFERRLAKSLGTERTPLSGGNSKHTRSDTLHPELFVEAKHRKRMATWKLWEETKEMAKVEDKLPFLALHQKGKKGWLYVVHSDDIDKFITLYRKSTGDYDAE